MADMSGNTNKEKTFSVREMIAALANCSDMDAEICVTLFNSDPVPVASVEENEDGQVVLGNN